MNLLGLAYYFTRFLYCTPRLCLCSRPSSSAAFLRCWWSPARMNTILAREGINGHRKPEYTLVAHYRGRQDFHLTESCCRTSYNDSAVPQQARKLTKLLGCYRELPKVSWTAIVKNCLEEINSRGRCTKVSYKQNPADYGGCCGDVRVYALTNPIQAGMRKV